MLYPIPRKGLSKDEAILAGLIAPLNQAINNINQRLKTPNQSARTLRTITSTLIKSLDSIYSKVENNQSDIIKKWFFINAKNIVNILNALKELPQNSAMSPELTTIVDCLLAIMNNPNKAFLNYPDCIHASANSYKFFCTAIVGSVSAAATTLSAFSFFAGPQVGLPVTGVTALVGGVSTGSASIFSYKEGKKSALTSLVSAIYTEFGMSKGR